MTGTHSRSRSPEKGNLMDAVELNPPRRTVMDAFNKTSWTTAEPGVKFGSSSRPPLNNPEGGPGPGSYPIKTTMGKLMESHIRTPSQFSIRGRTKFGDPNERALSKTSANEPGPCAYDLTGKFLAGSNPRKSAFPKAQPFRDKSQLGPGPGSYQPLQSMGKQVLSTKVQSSIVGFPKAERGSLVPAGATDIGPADYNPPPAACASQVDSRKPTCALVKFGEGYKTGGGDKDKKEMKEPAPGPGSYKLPGGIGTKTRGAPYRDSPTAILSGRNKFGSPW